MALKIVIADPKSKKAWQIEKDVPSFFGKKIGDKIEGSLIGMSGFTLQVTGGSDNEGFPMRYDMEGTSRKKVMLTKGVGFRGTKKIRKIKYKVSGLRRRKYIRGNTVSENIVQINLKILEGEGDIPMMLGIKPKEEPKVETPAETPKEEPKAEEKQEEKPQEPKQEEKGE